jgi:hypothetical protein
LISYLIPLAGIAAAAFSLLGTFAAHLSITRLRTEWEKCYELYKKVPATLPSLPGLSGGGATWAHRLGILAVLLPLLSLVWWIVILAYGQPHFGDKPRPGTKCCIVLVANPAAYDRR